MAGRYPAQLLCATLQPQCHCGRTGKAAEAVTATVSGWELGIALVAALGGGGEPYKVRAGIDLAWSRADSLRSSSCSADGDLLGCNESLWGSGSWLARGALLCVASAVEL